MLEEEKNYIENLKNKPSTSKPAVVKPGDEAVFEDSAESPFRDKDRTPPGIWGHNTRW